MTGVREWGRVACATAAAALALPAAPALAAEPEDAYPPFVHLVEDVTGDGFKDVVLGQPEWESPRDSVVTMVDGRTGAAVWREKVTSLVEVDALGPGVAGIVVASETDSGAADVHARTLRLRVVGGSGAVLWDRSFEARDVVPNLFPTYERSFYRGVVGGQRRVLVQSDVHVEGGIRRLTRTTPLLLDPLTGATVVSHEPFETPEHTVRLTPLPGLDAYGVLLTPYTSRVGDGSLRAVGAADGATRWTTPVRTSHSTEVTALVAGLPPRPALSVSTYYDGSGVQLVDAATGEKVVDRARGDDATAAGGTGTGRRIRTAYFRPYGEPAGYHVELLDLAGRVVAQRHFPLGKGTTFGTQYQGILDAGDVDRDGWRDVLVHSGVSGGGHPTVWDHRLIDGRTLASRAVPRNLEWMTWFEPGSAAVDGDGDDLYLRSDQRATVVDGRSLRPLLDLRTPRFLGNVVGMRDRGARCADALVVTFRRGGYAVTRVAPDGRVRWTTERGALAVRDVSGRAGCPATVPAAVARPATTPRGTIPATGGLPLAGVAVAVAGAAAALRRHARA